MADAVLPVLFNKGLDTVTPQLMAEEGSLMECMNYEITDIAGYRRVDGYERYDGFPNGAVSEFYRIDIVADVVGEQPLIVPGSVLFRSDNGENSVPIGVVVGGPFPTNLYDIIPFRNTDAFTVSEDFLLLQDGEAFVQLQGDLGLLKILGDAFALGDTFTIYTPTGVAIEVTTGTNLIEGGILMPAQEYLDLVRTYSVALRGEVDAAPGPVAGLYWFDDRLLAAINASRFTINVTSGGPAPLEGMRWRWNGTIYRVGEVVLEETGAEDIYTVYVYPIDTSGTVDDSVDEVTVAGVFVKEWAASVANIDGNNSEYAFLGYFNNPDIATVRGFVYLRASTNITFNTGTYAFAEGPGPTFDTNFYYIQGSDGTVLKVRLINLKQSGGDFTAGTATGTAQLQVVEVIAGTRDYIKNTDIVHTAYPFTASTDVLTVNSVPHESSVAGTKALDRNNSRYQWQTGNFYANVDSLCAYGANGAGYAFWANKLGYGTISTGVAAAQDIPKYVSFHVNKLALGFARGSVLLSVAGEPYNFNGAEGAIEVATGDNVTGLLELPGETLCVFGKRSIRKITGFTDSDTVLGTIAANTGCFDYTAVLLGQDAVFTGVHGVTTLQQTASYGDFSGKRLTDKISNWLRPKLISGFKALEQGGTVCAYPVRYKNQYRLVLANGDIVVVTITSEGPKISRINFGLLGETNIPYAWSSEIDFSGKERLHAVWATRPRSAMVYELDTGWGFDGRTFRHYFDLTHWFNRNGSVFGGIEKVRLYGQGYGVASLNVKSAGIEKDFKQAYHSTIQDISMPSSIDTLYSALTPVTSIIDQASWGLGVKLRFTGTTNEGTALTEPPHICQAAVLHVRSDGALDS